MDINFISFDKAASYIPGVSTVVNIPEIAYKLFITNKLDNKSFESDSINAYLADKSLIRCIVLLIPVLGNLAVLASDLIDLSRNSAQNSSTSPLLSDTYVVEEINNMIEKEKEAEIAFEEALLPILERVKENANALTSQIDQANEPIPMVKEELETAINQCTPLTKKIQAFVEQDDSFAGQIFDAIVLGLIAYTASDLSTLGILGAVIGVKTWSVVKPIINPVLSSF